MNYIGVAIALGRPVENLNINTVNIFITQAKNLKCTYKLHSPWGENNRYGYSIDKNLSNQPLHKSI